MNGGLQSLQAGTGSEEIGIDTAICAAGVTKQPFIEELKIDIRFAISSAKECLRNGD